MSGRRTAIRSDVIGTLVSMVMAAARPKPGMAISRAHVEAEADPTARTIERILHASDACDFVRAAVLALARASAGEDMPAGMVTQILPGIRDATLATSLCAIATGDRAAAWIACVRDRMFPDSAEASPIEVIVLYAAWRAGAPADQIAPEARRLARMKVGYRGYALLYTLATGLGDKNLIEATRHFRATSEYGSGPDHVATIDRVLASSVADIMDALPPQVIAQPVARGYTIRIAPRAGRNEPCACGSGQKFKRCCADKQPQVTPSPVAGLSWDDYVTKAADKMSADDVRGLPLRDLGRVDLHQLGDMPLVAAVGRFTRERLFDHAARGARELAHRNVDFIDGLRDEIIAEALEAGDVDTANAQLGLMRDPANAGLHRLEIELRTGHEGALAALANAADGAVRKDDSTAAVDLAHTLLRAMPGLGVLVARGCMRSGRAIVNDGLLGGIEETRDALNLPSGDPAWDVHAALKGDDDADHDDADRERVVAEASELRGSLRAASTRMDDLERQLAAKQAELETARTSQPARSAAMHDAADAERMRNLRFKVEELEGLVRAGNAERSDLRRQLAAGSTATRSSVTPSASLATDDRDDPSCEAVDDVDRGVAVPVISRKAQEALDEIPRTVAAEALRTIGGLAAGDASAWRRIKQAKDMTRPLLMARIGIHHRLLFRVQARVLEVCDLVTREELLATLKRMRSARS